jgi:hypothetical protein
LILHWYNRQFDVGCISNEDGHQVMILKLTSLTSALCITESTT